MCNFQVPNSWYVKIIHSLIFLLIIAAPRLVFSQSAFSFVNAPANARLSALGGVNVSLVDRDVNFFTSNPATTTDSLNGYASAGYQFYIADVGQTSVAYQQAVPKVGTLQMAIQHASYGSLTSYDASGAELGSFSSGETAIMIGKSFESNAFQWGVLTKGLFSNLAGFRASALAIDLGGTFVHPTKNVTIGLAIKNIGIVLKDYSETSESILPFDVQLGATLKPEHMPFRFSFTAFDLTKYDSFEGDNESNTTLRKVMRHLNVGTELLLSKNIAVLLGYNFRTRQDFRLEELSGGAGISFGFSVTVKAFDIVLSRVSYGPAQAAYGFTLNANMLKIIRKKEKI
jgi:hypothetical protein